MNASLFAAMLSAIAIQLPVILVCLGGCVLVLVRWRPLGKAAAPALVGCALAAALSTASPAIWVLFSHRLSAGHSAVEMRRIFAGVGFFLSLGWATALALLLRAVTCGRIAAPTASLP